MSVKDDAPQVYNGVSEADVPSAKLGWSELSPKTIQTAGWISVLFLIGYNFGNHRGHVETIWLIVIAVLIALGLILFALRPELSQVRTVTAHNKPEGHVEPYWTHEQHTLTGRYAELTDNQLRALNIDPASVHTNRDAHEAQGAREIHGAHALQDEHTRGRVHGEDIAAPEIPNRHETLRVQETEQR